MVKRNINFIGGDVLEKLKVKQIIENGIKKINIHDVIDEGWKIDKAKIKYILRSYGDVQRIADNLSYDSRVTSNYESGELKKCKYNYTLDCGGGSVYIGLEDNNTRNSDEGRKTVKIEYNPQKVDIFEEIHYLRELKLLDLHRRFIMYLDLAYDMYVDIKDVVYEKRRINEYNAIHGHSKLETVYLGTFGSHGAVRIYDKTKEMNKRVSKVDDETGEMYVDKYYGNCTRYEMRIKPEGKNNQLLMNIADPYFIEWLVKLHDINIAEKDFDALMLEEIEKYNGVDFVNLLSVHMGYSKKLNDRAKSKYRKIYDDMKKELLGSNPKSSTLNDFNCDCLFKTISSYINSITVDVERQSSMLLSTLISV